MNISLTNRKKLMLACGALATVLVGLIIFLIARGQKAESPRRREYPVEKGNIIVGIDAAGSVSSEKHLQFCSTPLQIKNYSVKIGDFVHKGDVIAQFATEDINQKLKVANEKLKNDNFAVQKLKTEKQNYQLELEKKISDIRSAGESAHKEKTGPLLSKKTLLEQNIADKKIMLEQLKEGNSSQPDTTVDMSEITRLESEITVLNTELFTIDESLKVIEEQRQQTRNQEDDSISLIIKQGQAQHAVYDNQISQAQSTASDSKKAHDQLKVFQKTPQIFAECDGVIVKLGYAPNATTEILTPIVEIGADDKKVLLLQVDPMDISDVKIGQKVSFYVDAYADATFYGTVESTSYLQNESVKFVVRVLFQQDEQKLLDGMGANATLIVKQKTNVITLANKAIFLEKGKSYAYVADERGNLERKEIITGFSNGRLTEIIEGISAGSTVFVEEQYENS